MQEQLARCVDEFVRARDRLHRLVHSRGIDRWDRRPAAGSWSAAECVVHLNLTGAVYVPLLRTALLEGAALLKARGGARVPGRYRRDVVGFLLSSMLGPLPGVGRFRVGRTRTVPRFEPGVVSDRAAVLAEFDRLQSDQIGIVREAEGLPLNEIRIVSPFDARVKYNLYSAFVLLPRHQHRHLAQAERAVD
jgi:hypothetical protein